MSGEGLLIILLVGLIAGYLAGQIVRGTGFGLVADLCIGIIGALIGSWLLAQLGVHLGDDRGHPARGHSQVRSRPRALVTGGTPAGRLPDAFKPQTRVMVPAAL